MSKKISKNLTYWLGVTAIGLILGLSIQFVRAWTEPSVAPPGGNVGAPVNTGDIGQIKGGNLTLNSNAIYPRGLTVNGNAVVLGGNVGIGTASPIRALQVQGELSITRDDRNAFINVSDKTGNNGGTIWLRGLNNNGSAQTDATVLVVGNVGIGTENPGSNKLSVVGNIYSSTDVCIPGKCLSNVSSGGSGTFYLTSNVANGANADTLCNAGYHICGNYEMPGRAWAKIGTAPMPLPEKAGEPGTLVPVTAWKDGKREGLNCHTQCYDWSSTAAGQEACVGDFLDIRLIESNCWSFFPAWCCSN